MRFRLTWLTCYAARWSRSVRRSPLKQTQREIKIITHATLCTVRTTTHESVRNLSWIYSASIDIVQITVWEESVCLSLRGSPTRNTQLLCFWWLINTTCYYFIIYTIKHTENKYMPVKMNVIRPCGTNTHTHIAACRVHSSISCKGRSTQVESGLSEYQLNR